MITSNVVHRIECEDDGIRIVLEGELDLVAAPETRVAIGEACREHKPGSLTIDLRGVNFIDSAGLALLVLLYKSQMNIGPLILDVGVRTQPERVLKLSHFDQFIKIRSFETPDSITPIP